MAAPAMRFSHVGIHVTDLPKMVKFYTRYLGFTVTDRGTLDVPGGRAKFTFMSRDPGEHHQFVVATGRPKGSFNTLNQVSFRVDGLKTLRALYAMVKKAGVDDLRPVTHGNALSVYFRDPEGNRIELFIDTPWYVNQPMRVPLDMELSDRALWKWAEQHARSLPGFTPVAKWKAALARRMRADQSRHLKNAKAALASAMKKGASARRSAARA